MDERRNGSGKILVVDDHPGVCDLLQAALVKEGYSVHGALDGQDALKSFFSWNPSMVITDVGMPRLDGWGLLTRIREVSNVPVIMLTALGEEQCKVRGLHEGADDYLVKPISLAELIARVEAIYRRLGQHQPQSTGQVYRDDALEMDFSGHRVTLRGLPLELSPQEFRVLAALVSRPGAVFSTDRLLDLCWPEADRGPESVRVYVGYLRKKLGAVSSHPHPIENVREYGYRYNPPAKQPRLFSTSPAGSLDEWPRAVVSA